MQLPTIFLTVQHPNNRAAGAMGRKRLGAAARPSRRPVAALKSKKRYETEC